MRPAAKPQNKKITSGIIFDIKRFAIHDGPGIRTTVFLKGCPLNCWWCHNPEGKHKEPEKILSARPRQKGSEVVGRVVTVDQVMAEIEKEQIFYDNSGGGVTFSGGEPLFQPNFLSQLLSECKKRDIHTVVDTCGYAEEKVMATIIPNTDIFFYDFKLIDEQEHIKYTGVSNKQIIRNLKLLNELKKPVYIRFTIVPGITDSPDNINGLKDLIGSFDNIQEVDILPYHRIGLDKYSRLNMKIKKKDIPVPEQSLLEQIGNNFKAMVKQVKIGG